MNQKHFDSSYKYSSATVDNITYFKGASEVILPRCTKYLKNGEERSLDNYDRINSEIKKAKTI